MPSVLIVGGGFAGINAALELRKNPQIQVTLVDRKDYFEVTPAQLRALVDPASVGDLSRIPYDQVLGAAFVQGQVTALEDRAAVLADGRRIAFDQVVLAPGTRYPKFAVGKASEQLSRAARTAYHQGEHERFRSAAGYLVIGGGLVGVELAGELAAFAPGKPVRLAHRGPRLVENLAPKASALALEHLRQLGVKVELDQGDARPENGELVYETVSPVPATEFLKDAGVLNDRGLIAVDAFLRVKGRTGWYAVGDANDAPDGKQASAAGVQGTYVAQALSAELAGRKVKPYRAGPTMALAPLGKTHGFAQLPFGVVTWKFLVGIKRKDFLVGMFRQRLGVEKS